MSRIPVSKPDLGIEEGAQVLEVLRSGWLTRGPKVAEFEEKVANYLGIDHAVAVSSGTAALHLALLALGIGPGDEVIVPDFTFPAPANVVRHCSAEPVLVDIDLETFNLSLEALRGFLEAETESTGDGLRDKRNGQRIRVIMPIHLFGLPLEMDPILEIAKQYGLSVIEDAACALGAQDRGRFCGTMGVIGCFSFHPRKVITTGEGGLIVTRDPELAERVRCLRNHGMVYDSGKPTFAVAGYNYRMSDLNAAIGVAQMDKLPMIISRNTEIARWYDEGLSGTKKLHLPRQAPGRIYQAYVVWLENGVERDCIMSDLTEIGIECVVGTYSVSAQPAFKGATLCQNSVQAQESSMALPLHAGLDKASVDRVCSELRRLLAS